ncbi:tRNA pseudouridine(55) synthase TruB [Mailhella massiliensis]|uniref:tRNA pseudouridine synthase B n=1 Tax=Mailhella massiliensis TaxID=1903261 RepID=A0A921AYD2_9BACT|nr:tRNA pseudouridine(55) synthase TruB [Mailhella massiliensis]HJD98122.1 tRNA pseudouridine(55) synthase TruB [Mailhella massiliensis]
MEQQHGILVLNKPKGLSSAQCIARIKRLGQKKIGHAGTLDPMATGVLLVLLGHATKLSGYLLEGGVKTYGGTLRLGVSTDTWDAEGSIVSETALGEDDLAEGSALELAARREVAAWLEVTEQPVPPYSAAKHQGQPLYKLARAGREVPAKVKTIHVSHASVQWVNMPDVRFRVTCSSGSYIRSLAHSLGIRLGCGAMLTELTREYSHPFGLDVAHTLDEVLAEPEKLPERLMPISAALPGWKNISIPPRQEANLKNGIAVPHLPEFGDFLPGERALITAQGGSPLALAEARMDRERPVWAVLRGLFTH